MQIAIIENLTSSDALAQRNPREYLDMRYISGNYWATFLLPTVWVYFHSFSHCCLPNVRIGAKTDMDHHCM